MPVEEVEFDERWGWESEEKKCREVFFFPLCLSCIFLFLFTNSQGILYPCAHGCGLAHRSK